MELWYGSARQPVPYHRSNEYHHSKQWIHGMLTVSVDKCISQYMATNKDATQLLATYCAYAASRVGSTQDWVSCNTILCAVGDRVTQCVRNKCNVQYFGGADESIWGGYHIWYPTIQWAIGYKRMNYSQRSNGSQKQGGTTQKYRSKDHQRNQQEEKSSRWGSTGSTHWPIYYKGSEHLLVVRKTCKHYIGRSQRRMEYQRGTGGINLESGHSETEALCHDATQQKIQGIQNVWGQTTQLHDVNLHHWCTGKVHSWPEIIPGIWKHGFLCGSIPDWEEIGFPRGTRQVCEGLRGIGCNAIRRCNGTSRSTYQVPTQHEKVRHQGPHNWDKNIEPEPCRRGYPRIKKEMVSWDVSRLQS